MYITNTLSITAIVLSIVLCTGIQIILFYFFLRISKNNMATILKRRVLVPIINTSRWGIIGSNNTILGQSELCSSLFT